MSRNSRFHLKKIAIKSTFCSHHNTSMTNSIPNICSTSNNFTQSYSIVRWCSGKDSSNPLLLCLLLITCWTRSQADLDNSSLPRVLLKPFIPPAASDLLVPVIGSVPEDHATMLFDYVKLDIEQMLDIEFVILVLWWKEQSDPSSFGQNISY